MIALSTEVHVCDWCGAPVEDDGPEMGEYPDFCDKHADDAYDAQAFAEKTDGCFESAMLLMIERHDDDHELEGFSDPDEDDGYEPDEQ